MKVTINGVEYEIVVTDATAGFFLKNDFSGVGAESNTNCYLMYGTRNNGSGWGINVHRYQDSSGKLYWAYCLDWGRTSDGSSSSPDTGYSVSSSAPSSPHGSYVSSYALAPKVAMLGYGNQSAADAKRMFGLSAAPNAYEYYQATQAAMWAVIKSGTDSEPESVSNRPFKVRAAPSHTDTIGVSLANKIAEAAYAIYQSPPTITLANFTRTNLALTTATYQTTVTWNNCYGGFDLVFSNLPSGYKITKSGTASTVSGSTVSSTKASGTATIKITIPRQSAAKTVKADLTTIINSKSMSVKYGEASSRSKQNFMYLSAVGSPIPLSKNISVPPLPTGSITVMKKDVYTGANLQGCVFGLKKWDGSKYVDTGTTATTGSDGKASFSGLTTDATSTGKYSVYEKSAPAGYEMDSSFFLNFVVGTGWYSYKSALAGTSSDTLSNGGTVTATINGQTKNILSVSKGANGFDATVYAYDPPKPPDSFSITLNKRDLSTGNALTGATYQLYVANSSGAWTQFKSGTVNTSGTVTFTGLKLADSSNGKFRVIESAMSNGAYQRDASFEVIMNPSNGQWSYQGSFLSTQTGTFTSATTVKSNIALPGGGTVNRNIIATTKDDSLYDYTVWQDDHKSAEHHLTVKKVVDVEGEAWPVPGMTFTLMRQNGSAWASVGTLTETAANSGIYQVPETSTGWTFSMVEGGTYKVAETSAAAGVVNSGWESPTFVWNEGIDLNLSYTVQNSIPTGHIGILKVNSETNAPIAGVGFKIAAAENIITTIGRNSTTWYSAGEEVATGETDAEGKLVVRDLPFGKYSVTETSHPANYAHENVSFTVTIGAPSGYSGAAVYPNPMIGYTTYPAGMNVVTANGLRYVTVGNTPIHPDMAVSKLTERTVNPSGSAVTFNAATGRYTQDKIPGTYFNGQNAKFLITVTNTGDVDLYDLHVRDVMSEQLWTVVQDGASVRWRQRNDTPLALGQELLTGSKVNTTKGNKATVTDVEYDTDSRTFSIRFDRLAVGDSFQIQITCSICNKSNLNQSSLPNDVYLYSSYMVNGTQGPIAETPGGGEGDCHDMDRLNVVSQGSITIHKRSTDGQPLSDVHFELYNADGQKVPFVRQSNGDYSATVKLENGDWIAASASGQTTTTDLVTDSSGELRITELPEGTYSLVETRTVSGQTLLNDPVSITMPTIKSGSEIELEGNVYFDNANHFYALEYIITNSTQFRLPSTGGTGHLPAVLFGLLMLAGLFLMLNQSKKEF